MPSQSYHGLVVRRVDERKRVFKYTPKGCKNQIVTAGRLLAVLDMRPSTTRNTTNNQDSILTASSTTTLVQRPYFSQNTNPKITNKSRHLLTQPRACCIFIYPDEVIFPILSTSYDSNQSAQDIYDYACS